MAKLSEAQRWKLRMFKFGGFPISAPLNRCSPSFRRLVARRLVEKAAVKDGVPVYRITPAGRKALQEQGR